MDIKDKVTTAIARELAPEYIRLEDDDGISGFVVSGRFEKMSTLDRQDLIDNALDKASLAPEERRRVLMIAGLTPREYEAVGARIRVHSVREMAGAAVEVRVHGATSDAEYVRGTLNNEKGVQTSEPKAVAAAKGILLSFRAKGTQANPLTRERAIRILKRDPYIEVVPKNG